MLGIVTAAVCVTALSQGPNLPVLQPPGYVSGKPPTIEAWDARALQSKTLDEQVAEAVAALRSENAANTAAAAAATAAAAAGEPTPSPEELQAAEEATQALQEKISDAARTLQDQDTHIDALQQEIGFLENETVKVRKDESTQNALYNAAAQTVNGLLAYSETSAHAVKQSEKVSGYLNKHEGQVGVLIVAGAKALQLADVQLEGMNEGTARRAIEVQKRSDKLFEWTDEMARTMNGKSREIVDLQFRVKALNVALEKAEARILDLVESTNAKVYARDEGH